MALSTRVIPDKLLDVIKKSRLTYQVLRSVRFAIGSALGARKVDGIPGRVHYNDFTLVSAARPDVEHYHADAVSFVNILENALKSCGRDWSDIQRCLEVGCGYGRIVRALKEKMSPSRIYVCDVIEEGPKFVTSAFGAVHIPILEKTLPNEYENFFDLVYLYSVYTHMRMEDMERSIKLIVRALKRGGFLVFTTHGVISARGAERYKHYWLNKELLNVELAKNGYFYAKYPYYSVDYGMTWYTEDYAKHVVAQSDKFLQLLNYGPAVVDNHQDLFVYRLGAAQPPADG